jgi:hypothetical protein
MAMSNFKLTALINGYSLFKIPILSFITPRIIECSETRTTVRVRLGWRTKNHLGVMYFGALAVGAELSIALKAVEQINESGKKISFIFKDFQAEFIKRADGHVHFVCDEAQQVAALIAQAGADQERHNQTFSGYAFVPAKSDEPVMKFKLTLSVKQR